MTEPAPRRIPVAALAAGCAALLAAAFVVSAEIGSMGGDNADYVLLAKSIRAGEGYRNPWMPGEVPLHTQYPPVWPLLLVPFVGGAPGSFLAAHVPLVLAAGIAVFLLSLLFERRGLPPWAAAAAALAPALSIFFLRCAGDLLSEIPFLAFVAGALLAMEQDGDAPLPPRRVAIAASCACLAFLTRTAGLALVIPLAAALALDRRARGRAGWIGIGAMAAVVMGWFAYGHFAGNAGGYGDQLGSEGLLARGWKGFTSLYLPGTPRFLFVYEGLAWRIAGGFVWGAAAASLFLGFRRRRTLAVTEGFFLVYLAMQSAWPFLDPRFALPLAALLPGLATENMRFRFGPCLALALLLPNAWFCGTRVLPRAHREGRVSGFTESWRWSDAEYAAGAPFHESYLLACDAVRAGAEAGLPEGTLLAQNPRIAALLCGRRALPLPPAGTDLGEFAREKGVALVLADAFRGGVSDRLGAALPPGWEPVISLPGGVRLIRVQR